LDAGANREVVEMIINHPRIQNALDSHYMLNSGAFRELFLSGKAMLMFDRLKLRLHAGGDELFYFIEDICWMLEEDDLPSLVPDSLAQQQVDIALTENPIVAESLLDKSKSSSTIIKFSQFVRS